MNAPAPQTTFRGGKFRRERVRNSGRERATRILLDLERLEDRSLAAAGITEVSIPSNDAQARGIAAGPDGAIWFTELNRNQIGRATTSGVVTEFSLPTPNSDPYELVSASDGAIWFTENNGNKIGRITTSGAVTEYNIPTADSEPQGIALGSDGALWFTENKGKKIGRITTSGAITEYALASNREPEAITAGPDGALWFTDSQNSSIGRITTSGTITTFAVPGSGRSFGEITTGPDGALWFTDTNRNQILRMTTSGTITTFAVPTSSSKPVGIAAGPDGALWFTESADSRNKIGRITTSGVITETTVPTGNSVPLDITLGPDGALWFVENKTDKLGRVSTTGAPTSITVDTTSDVVDGVTTSIAALLANTGLDGHISLREAILAANLTPGPNEIRFAIPDSDPNHLYYRNNGAPGSFSTPVRTTLADASIADFDPDYPYAARSWFRIDLNPALPELQITDALTIDGYSQPGAFANTLVIGDDASIRIELACTAVNGNYLLSGNRGLFVASGAGGSLIRGLSINRFGWSGILVDQGADGTTVEGNFLGTDVTGTVALGNGDDGIQVRSSDNVIGGSTPAARNVISGNRNRGLNFFTLSGTTDNNVVQNNYLGVDATGTRPLGNATQGIAGYNLSGSFIVDNVVSANKGAGLWFRTSTATGNTVQGNLIGTDAGGSLVLGNLGDGILIDNGAGGELIGGTAPGQGNVIAYNGGDGIDVSSGTGSAILGNAIFGNGELGIDLNGDGVTPNNGNKPPGQPNVRMNYPVIVSATPNGANLDVSGYVGNAPNQSVFGGARVEFFAAGNDPSNHGEAPVYLGYLIADANGNFSGSILAGGLDVGDSITATATDGANNTSEFATNAPITSASAPPSANNLTSVYGQSLTIRVTVSGPSGTPTGTVTFLEGTTVLDVVTLSGGVAVFSTSTLDAGLHNITVRYNGDHRYRPSSITVTATVTPAPLTVIADRVSKTYGAATPALTYSYAGLTNGDTAAVFSGSLSSAATAGSHVGSYAIGQGTLSAGPNYAIVYSPGTIDVVPAPLTVTADDATRVYGQPNPVFSASYSGLVNGDTPASLGGTLGFSTPATTASPAGTYPIVPGGLTSADYAITFADGTLTVQAPVYSASGATVAAEEDVPFAGEVATFTSSDPTPRPQDYSATILWGDGQVSAGLIAFDPIRGVYTVEGTNTYRDDGAYAIQVVIRDGGAVAATASGTAVIADSTLRAAGRFFLAVEGSPFSRTVATFTDSDADATAGDFSATIDWGDGTASQATVSYDPVHRRFVASGDHTYVHHGIYRVRVTIADADGSTATAIGFAFVFDAPMTAAGRSFAAVEGSPFTAVVATFTDANPAAVAGDFSATIDWGDGHSSAGVVERDPDDGGFRVVGTSTYAAAGLYPVRVTIRDDQGDTVTAGSLAIVSGAEAHPSLTAEGVAIAATEAVGFSGTVGSFADGETQRGPGYYTVTIDWGDGTSSAGSVIAQGRAGYVVNGSHTYAAAGRYTVSISVAGIGGELATAVSAAIVSGGDAGGGTAEPPVIVEPTPGPIVPTTPVGTPSTVLPPTVVPVVPTVVVGLPFVPPPPSTAGPAIVPATAPTAGGPATIVPAPRATVTQFGESLEPATAPVIPPGRSGDAPAPGTVAPPGPPSPHDAGNDQAAVPVAGPRQGGDDAVAQLVGGLVQVWMAAVEAAGDEAAAVVTMLERAPAAGAATTVPDARGERDFPKDMLWSELDGLHREVGSGAFGETLQQVFGATVVAYVGYVLLSSRSGFWLVSLLMARPLWKDFDPLQVLMAWDEEKRASGDREEDDETLQSMVADDHPTLEESKGRKHVADQPRPRQPHRESPARRARAGTAAGPRRRGARRAKSAL